MDDNERKQRIPNGTGGAKRSLILFGVWVLFTAAVLAVGLPVVLDSIKESGVISLLASTSAPTSKRGGPQARVWFFISDGTAREFSQQQVNRGGSAYHDTFETLLEGPDLQALKQGAVSSINPKTLLRGITLSNKILYIDVSRHFLESQDLQAAYEQLKRTGTGFSQVKDIVLLIEGERATLAGVT